MVTLCVVMIVCVWSSYTEDDNIALLLGLPADDISLLQRENLFYQALPVLLYLVAYAFMFLYGYVAHAYVAVAARILSPVVHRYVCLSFVRFLYFAVSIFRRMLLLQRLAVPIACRLAI